MAHVAVRRTARVKRPCYRVPSIQPQRQHVVCAKLETRTNQAPMQTSRTQAPELLRPSSTRGGESECECHVEARASGRRAVQPHCASNEQVGSECTLLTSFADLFSVRIAH